MWSEALKRTFFMEILGVGPLELLFILIIALIVLGPKDMVQAGRTMGKWMRKVVTSPTYAIFQKTSRDLRGLPYRLMREAGMEEWEQMRKSIPTSQEILPKTPILPTPDENDAFDLGLKDWTSPQATSRFTPSQIGQPAPSNPSNGQPSTEAPAEPDEPSESQAIPDNPEPPKESGSN